MIKTTKTIRRLLGKICLTVIMLSTPAFVLATQGQFLNEPDFDEVSTGTLFLKNAVGYQDAPVLNSAVNISVSGVVSKIELTQSFQNNSSDWVEGLYVFPLPDSAAVNSMVVQIGDREITGSIHEKKQAEKEFEKAKQAGKIASIIKQHRPNLFSTRFANIPPGESISIVLGYIQTVRYENDRYSLRVPLTITPRFSNALVNDVAAITPPQVNLPDNGSDQSIRHKVTINTMLYGSYDVKQISSPSHTLRFNAVKDGAQIDLVEEAHLDRDFILEWFEFVEEEPAVQVWRQSVAGEEYVLATIMPPMGEALIPEQPRELILVIDTSGSMAGGSIEAAKAALLDALAGLRPEDNFNIIEFDSDYTQLFNQPQPANEQNRLKARRFTNRLQADGGTQIIDPMRAALGYSNTGLLRQVVFITDGSIGYEESVVESVTQNLGQTRLFTVGIGTAPNQWFMRKVAEAGRGTYHLISDLSEVHSEMSRLLVKLESPALTNISLDFVGGSAEVVPNPVPDLYANEPVVIAAKLTDNPQSISVTGQWGAQTWNASVDINEAPITQTGLSTVWARQKIESLEDKQRFQSDPDFYRSLILRTALDHQLLSQYTAFLAIDKTPVREVGDPLVQKKIPNLMPHGSAMHNITLPQGASGIDTLLLLGLLASFAAFITFCFQHFDRSQELS